MVVTGEDRKEITEALKGADRWAPRGADTNRVNNSCPALSVNGI